MVPAKKPNAPEAMKASYQDEPLAAEKVQQPIYHMIPVSCALHLLLQKIILNAVCHVDQAHKLLPVFNTQQTFRRSNPVFRQIDQLSDRQTQPGLLKPGQGRGCLPAKRDVHVARHRAADTAGEYTVAGESRIAIFFIVRVSSPCLYSPLSLGSTSS